MSKKIKCFLAILAIFIVLGSMWFLSPLSGFAYDKKVEFTISFVGALIGGITTLVALWISTIETRKIQEDSKTEQGKLITMNENKELKINAFIIENDLKICFKDLFNILVKYAINNAIIISPPNQRKEWILSWKEILRGINFSSNWREEVKTLSNKIEKDYLIKIYEMYTLLERSIQFLNLSENTSITYELLYRNIELIPKEFIFNEEFIQYYLQLRNKVSDYDYEIEKKGSNSQIDYYKLNGELKEEIYQLVEGFKVIEQEQQSNNSKYYDFLNNEWKEIFEKLNQISNSAKLRNES